MGERHVRSRRRRLHASSVRRWLTPGPRLSIEEQIQSAADQYEADIRAAGARYDAAMARILTGLQTERGSLPGHQPMPAEYGDPVASKAIDTVSKDAMSLVAVDQARRQIIDIKAK